MTGAGAATFGHDGRGNLTSAPGVTYGYDLENMLTSVTSTTPGTASATLFYDPAGRLAEYNHATSTRFIYDGAQIASEYLNGSTTPRHRYVYGSDVDEPLVWYDYSTSTPTRRWFHADERGSIIAISN